MLPPVVALHLAVALFGFAALFGDWIALAPTAIVVGRTTVAAITLTVVLRLRRQSSGRANIAMVANGALLALHWVAFFAAVQTASVAIALLGYASFPVFVLLLDRGARRHTPLAVEIGTVVAVLAGLVLLVPDLSWSNRAVHGLAWGIVSGFTFALLTLRNRSLLPTHGAIALALWQNAFAALWLVPSVVLAGSATMPSARDIALVGLLGVFCTALAHSLFIA